MPKLETLKDNFDDNSMDTTKWAVNTAGGNVTVSETNQQLEITPATSTPGSNYGKYNSINTFDFTESYCYVKVPQVVTGAATEQQLIVQLDEQNKIVLFYNNGGLVCRYTVAGVNDDHYPGYDAEDDLWWRLREASGRVYWETSPDAVTWVNKRDVVTPFAITAVTVELQAGTYDSQASPGKAIFDQFNYAGLPAEVDSTDPSKGGWVTGVKIYP